MKNFRGDLLKECEKKLIELHDQYTKTLNRPMDNVQEDKEIVDLALRQEAV